MTLSYRIGLQAIAVGGCVSALLDHYGTVIFPWPIWIAFALGVNLAWLIVNCCKASGIPW